MKSKNNLLALMVASLGLCVCSAAFAKGADANGDDKLSKEEVVQQRTKGLDKKFEKLDSNTDGQITMDEMKGKRGVAKKADINKDGVITKEEAKTHMSETVDKHFAKKDTNDDGYIDAAERKKTKSNKAKKAKLNKAQKVKKGKTDAAEAPAPVTP